MLSHPNVVTLYDVVEGEDGSFFMAMEYVEGRSLAEILEEAGPLISNAPSTGYRRSPRPSTTSTPWGWCTGTSSRPTS
jgi:serine/threonine protein kinase